MKTESLKLEKKTRNCETLGFGWRKGNEREISSKYFLKSFLPVISTKYNRISQNLIKAFFSNFPLVSFSPTKTECLTISFFSSLSLFPRQMTDYKTTRLPDQSTNAANCGKDVTTRLAKKLRTISYILVQYLT